MNQAPNRWLRYMGMGVEFAAAFGVFVVVGWWVGRHTDTNPWATLVGAGLGFIGAMYNLIRDGLRLAREESSRRRREPGRQESGVRGGENKSSG